MLSWFGSKTQLSSWNNTKRFKILQENPRRRTRGKGVVCCRGFGGPLIPPTSALKHNKSHSDTEISLFLGTVWRSQQPFSSPGEETKRTQLVGAGSGLSD